MSTGIDIDDVRGMAAQAWCQPTTEHKQMDPELAEAFAWILKAWIDTGSQFARNEEFYRDLLDKCAESIGPEAYTSDDGSVQDSPLRLKIPEIVARVFGG